LYPLSPNYNTDLINYYYNKNTYNTTNEPIIKKALKLSDLIFITNLDKTYFLKQYIKGSETSKTYSLCRKLTSTK